MTAPVPRREEPAWVHPHAHDPNPDTPAGDGSFMLHLPSRPPQPFSVADLQRLPATTVADCYIISTGHGASGPFRFTGVALQDFLQALLPAGTAWRHVDVVSADGFGTRLHLSDLAAPPGGRPPLLAYAVDDAPLTRAQGLVRLIVPAEVEDALRQVKWIHAVAVAGSEETPP